MTFKFTKTIEVNKAYQVTYGTGQRQDGMRIEPKIFETIKEARQFCLDPANRVWQATIVEMTYLASYADGKFTDKSVKTYRGTDSSLEKEFTSWINTFDQDYTTKPCDVE